MCSNHHDKIMRPLSHAFQALQGGGSSTGNAADRGLLRFRLANYRAGLTASTAGFVSSGAGGKEDAIPRIRVAKIVPCPRTTVGCQSSVLGVCLKAHQERLGAPEPFGYRGYMHRTYIAIQLLRHGPLNIRNFRDITGWTQQQSEATLQKLRETKRIKRIGHATYRLTDWTKEL